MKRLILLSLVAASLLSAAPKKQAKKHGHRVPGLLNAATYPVRKGAKPLAKATLRVLW